jgi:hypothetical protein
VDIRGDAVYGLAALGPVLNYPPPIGSHYHSGFMDFEDTKLIAEPADSQNAAIALRLHFGRTWRGVCDPFRSARIHAQWSA